MKMTRLLWLIGVFLFVYILLNIDLVKTLDILSKANIPLIALAVVMLVPVVTLKAVKWRILIGIYDKNYPLRSAIKAWLMGFSLSMVTPARLGDLSRAYHVKDRIGVGKGITTVILDRVIDVAILFCLAIIGFVGLAALFSRYSGIFFTVALVFAAFVLGVYLFTKKRFMENLFRPLFNRFVPEKHKSNVNLTFHDFYEGLTVIKRGRRSVFIAALIGLLVWFVSVFQYLLLAQAIGIDVSYIFLLSVVPIVSLLDMLPISFSGIGTRDAALILFLSFASVGKEYAISLSILVLVFAYFLIGLAGAIVMLKEHSRVK